MVCSELSADLLRQDRFVLALELLDGDVRHLHGFVENGLVIACVLADAGEGDVGGGSSGNDEVLTISLSAGMGEV